MANQYSIASVGPLAAKTALAPMHGNLHAVMKNSKSLKYCIPNEYICAEIGRFIGLPIPPCGICYKKGFDPEHWFASLNFNLTNSSLPPIDPAECVKMFPLESTGLVLFDILILNEDRHPNNLSLDLLNVPPVMNVFDHSHAFFGPEDGKGASRLQICKDMLFIDRGHRHCLLGAITSDEFFGEWVQRIKSLPGHLIDRVCGATVPLGMISVAEAAAAKEFLNYRKEHIETIIKNNKKEFQGITIWSLM